MTVVEDLIQRLDAEQQIAEKSTKVETSVYRLRNVAVMDVAESIKPWLENRIGSNDHVGKCVITPEVVSNSLIVTNSFSDDSLVKELDQLIRELDKHPDMFRVEMTIKRTVNGKEVIVSRPSIVTLDNLPGSVTIGSELDSITVELTPQLVKQEDRESTRVTRIPPASSKSESSKR